MNIIDCYEKYYTNPDLNNAEKLWNSITEYNFESYDTFKKEIIKLFLSIKKKYNSNFFYKTNGSVNGFPTKYTFGPNSTYWLNKIESWKEFQSDSRKKSLYISDSFPYFPNNEIGIEEINNNTKIDYLLKLNFNNLNKSFELLKEQIKIKYEKHGPVHLFSRPNRFLFLFSHEDISNFLIENKNMIKSIISCDWEPFFKKNKLKENNIHVNNQMLNWHTCVNFTTCKYGTLHFLPIFIYGDNFIVNLLNLCNIKKMPLDDGLRISNEKKLCDCGKQYLPIKFFGHYQYQPRNNKKNFLCEKISAENLESKFLSISFLQYKNQLYVPYVSKEKIKEKDVNFLYDVANENGLNLIFVKNKYFSVGIRNKLYFFWKFYRESDINKLKFYFNKFII